MVYGECTASCSCTKHGLLTACAADKPLIMRSPQQSATTDLHAVASCREGKHEPESILCHTWRCCIDCSKVSFALLPGFILLSQPLCMGAGPSVSSPTVRPGPCQPGLGTACAPSPAALASPNTHLAAFRQSAHSRPPSAGRPWPPSQTCSCCPHASHGIC